MNPSHFPIVVLALFVSTSVIAGESKIQQSELPPSVQTTVKKLVGKGSLTQTTREQETGKPVIFEVGYTKDSKRFEAEISAEGKVIVVDQQIEISEAPAAVQSTIKEKTTGAKIIKIEKATEGKKTYFEAEFSKNGKKHEVKVAPDGAVIAEE